MTTADVQLERARQLLAIESDDHLLLIEPDGTITRLDGDTAALATAVLAYTTEPRTRDAILAHVADLTGVALEDLGIVDELLAVLREKGALVRAEPRAARARANKRVLVGVGGAVMAAHAPLLIAALQARGYEVRAVASEHALRFVAREALEALTHRAVFSSMWQRDEGVHAPHIELAAWPDAVLLWPATAATISRIATGDTTELLSAIAIATRAPVLVAPSMNAAMLEAPSVRRNLEQLKDDGFHLAWPVFAVEVAEKPDMRALMLGGAPPPEAIASLLEALLRIRAQRE